MGDGRKVPAPVELGNRAVGRYSVVSNRNLAAGAEIRMEDLTVKRPGSGISPRAIDSVVGCRVLSDIPVDTVICREMLEEGGCERV